MPGKGHILYGVTKTRIVGGYEEGTEGTIDYLYTDMR